MRSAKPQELKQSAFPIITAQLSEAELVQWFPVTFEEIDDPLAAPEPSKGALIKLEAGELVVLDYGKESNQLIVRVAADVDASLFLGSILREVPRLRSRILWRRPGTRLPRNVAAKQVTTASNSKPRRRSMATRNEKYYHDQGEQDATKGRHNPPHQGPVFSKDWWASDSSGRPVIDKDKRANYDAYEKGHRNASKQKK